jgi:hypothetical protein
MDSSAPTPPSNITPLRARPSLDDTRKRKAVATPTRPTPPRIDRLISPHTVGTGNSFAPVRNPYKRSSTPQPNARSTVAVTPSSSAKKTSRSSSAPPILRKKKAAPRVFTLSTFELYLPFRAGCLAYNQGDDTTDAANDDAANDGVANDGAANDGTASDGAANDGAANDYAVKLHFAKSRLCISEFNTRPYRNFGAIVSLECIPTGGV